MSELGAGLLTQTARAMTQGTVAKTMHNDSGRGNGDVGAHLLKLGLYPQGKKKWGGRGLTLHFLTVHRPDRNEKCRQLVSKNKKKGEKTPKAIRISGLQGKKGIVKYENSGKRKMG